jgi:hypothetical protein
MKWLERLVGRSAFEGKFSTSRASISECPLYANSGHTLEVSF